MLHVPVPETAVPVPQPTPTEGRKTDFVRLESAIADAKGDALLLGLAVDDAFQVENEAWSMTGRPAEPGYKLLMLTDEQVTAVEHASERIFRTVKALEQAFYDRNRQG